MTVSERGEDRGQSPTSNALGASKGDDNKDQKGNKKGN